MKNWFLLLFCIELTSHGVFGEDEHLVKKGVFPYMAFIYYTDPSVVDATGARFIRSAVLIRDDWLVTSALGPSVRDSNGFPKKTLLARVGAVTIDGNFTLNEDEDEQEREVIQIVRPYNHIATQWWTTDISLMRTLMPFNMTTAVAVKRTNVKRDSGEKPCIILVYAKKYANRTDDKALMQLSVELLPSTLNSCGSYFSANTMTCAADSDENKNAVYDPNYCQSNSGGPLICDSELTGLQTYIENDCKQPHLYQLLSSWDNFITCGIEDKCHEEHCGNICDVTYKDPPKTDKTDVKLVHAPSPTELTTTSAVSETSTAEFPKTSTFFVTTEDKEVATETTSTETATPTLTPNYSETTPTVPWPKEREDRKIDEEEDGRKANVELQQAKKKRNAAAINMCFVQTAFFGLLLNCLF